MENLASVMLLSPSETIPIQITLAENFLSARATRLICHCTMCFSFLLAARDMIGQCGYTTAKAPEYGPNLLSHVLFSSSSYTSCRSSQGISNCTMWRET